MVLGVGYQKYVSSFSSRRKGTHSGEGFGFSWPPLAVGLKEIMEDEEPNPMQL